MATALKIIIFDAGIELFRHNDKPGGAGVQMNALYTLDRPTYFLLDEGRLKEYEQHYSTGGSSKAFSSTETFRLLDMGDVNTVNLIKAHATSNEFESLNKAFPFKYGVQRRFSSADTKVNDDIAMAAICRIIAAEGIDVNGSYSPEQLGEDGTVVFHQEVMLCPSAFPHFKVSRKIQATAPPKIFKRGITSDLGGSAAGAGGGGSRLVFAENDDGGNSFFSRLASPGSSRKPAHPLTLEHLRDVKRSRLFGNNNSTKGGRRTRRRLGAK